MPFLRTPGQNGHQERMAVEQAGPSGIAGKEVSAGAETGGAPGPGAGARDDGAAAPSGPSSVAAKPPTESAAAGPQAEHGNAKAASTKEEKGAVHLKGHQGRTKGGLVVPKGGRGSAGRQNKGGWTGAGFDVDESA